MRATLREGGGGGASLGGGVVRGTGGVTGGLPTCGCGGQRIRRQSYNLIPRRRLLLELGVPRRLMAATARTLFLSRCVFCSVGSDAQRARCTSDQRSDT
eukprot:549623-Prorocentrum_minimum.AAC.1